MLYEELAARINVSRETFERLEVYAELLKKWTTRINLVSPKTLENLWERHILDSAQIYGLAEGGSGRWADFGSGGGFPGLVVAIIDADRKNFGEFVLVESDQRKAAFLRTVARETETSVRVVAERVETIPPLEAGIVSARALADLSTLLGFAERHAKNGANCLFLKGARWQNEVDEARVAWSFELEAVKSITDPDAVILRIGEVARA